MKLGVRVGLGPGHIVLDRDPCLPSPKGHSPRFSGHICHLVGGRPRPNRHCVRWGLGSPLPKKGTKTPILRPCLLWPNCCVDQDETWYTEVGVGPGVGPGQAVLDGDSAHPRPEKNGAQPQIYFCSMSVCKQLDGSRYHLVRRKASAVGIGYIVLDENPAPPQGVHPQFSAHAYGGQTVAHLSYC